MPEDTATPPALTRPPMELWESVCVTDPAHTKHINQRGGFTAIDAQYQIKTATAQWGPMGEAWGIRGCEYGYVYEYGQDKSQKPVEAWFEGVFFYPDGLIEISTDMLWRAGDECRKKLRTNAITKALSQLGFNSDVFEGKFDDNAYVAEQRRAQQQGNGQQQSRGGSSAPRQPPRPPTAGKQGKGGPDSECPRCGTAGITPRNFDANSNRPDLECPGFDGGPPCMGREKNNGGHWPLGWYSWPKGSGPNNPPPSHQQSQAAIDAQRPLEGPPVDAYDDDIPF